MDSETFFQGLMDQAIKKETETISCVEFFGRVMYAMENYSDITVTYNKSAGIVTYSKGIDTVIVNLQNPQPNRLVVSYQMGSVNQILSGVF